MRRGSMKRIWMWCLIALAGGCQGIPSGVAIVPMLKPDEQAVLDGKALVLVNLNAGQGVETKPDEKPEVEKCACGGTGRSGDGLGPCSCKPDCSCHKVRAEIQPVPISDEQQDATAVKKAAEQIVSDPEILDPFLEVQDDVQDNLESLTKIADKLTKNQVEITNRVMDHESRLKALEDAAKAVKSEPEQVKPTGFTVEQATKVRQVPVKAIVVSQDNCPPCERMAAIFPSLESSGWKIGDAPDCQIQRVKLTDLVSTNEAADAISRTRGTPYTAFYKDGQFVKGVSGEMSAKQFADTINEIATGKAILEQQTIVVPRKRMPVVKTQWGVIDLETYSRNCNCPMCEGIRALQAGYSQTVMPVNPAQQPTPSPVVDRVMEELQLSPEAVFADIGCGDGRLLIDAVTHFGCKAVGIEIDPVKAEEARKRVKAAGLERQITVLTGDAKKFDPKAYNVTAAVAYLYPELLSELKPMLETIPVLITPYHQVPGLVMERDGDLFVRDVREQPPLLN